MPNKKTRNPEKRRERAKIVAKEVATACGPEVKEAKDILEFRGQLGDPLHLLTTRIYSQVNPRTLSNLRLALSDDTFGNIATELNKGIIMF
jgi:hypothetical protein